jgi:hypothetical protein
MGHENSYQIAIKSLFWLKCWIASYNTQEANSMWEYRRKELVSGRWLWLYMGMLLLILSIPKTKRNIGCCSNLENIF